MSRDKDMTSLVLEADLIEHERLGASLEIYEPPTISTLTGGILLLVLAISIASFLLYNVILTLIHTTFLSTFTISSSFLIQFCILGLLFSFWVIFLFVLGIREISRAIADRNLRVVVCTHGVAIIRGLHAESFRWQDVLTTFYFTRYRNRHTYTVHCQDGRKFVFQNLSGLQNLAESIDVQVARAKRS